MADDIPAPIKQQRNAQLLELVNTIAERDNRRFIGKTLEVLVEGPSKMSHRNPAEDSGHIQLVGRTAHDYIVILNGLQTLAGEFINVKITDTSAITLFGEML
jgi:tRNA-2-methylthio-N6-dimethylallyladenosine synthase